MCWTWVGTDHAESRGGGGRSDRPGAGSKGSAEHYGLVSSPIDGLLPEFERCYEWREGDVRLEELFMRLRQSGEREKAAVCTGHIPERQVVLQLRTPTLCNHH